MGRKHVVDTIIALLEEAVVLTCLGAVLGALTGTACLLLLSLPGIGDWTLHEFGKTVFLGTFVGAPLGAVGAPVLGLLLLRRVPMKRTLLYTPLGTVIGGLLALWVGWLRADIAEGAGLLYLIGGAVFGLVLTAVVLRARVGRGDPITRFTAW